MEPVCDRAIVLKTSRYEERSLIVHALTENHGHVVALAKNGIQSKRFTGALEIFSASQWIFTQRKDGQMLFLKEAQLLRSFTQIRLSFLLLSLASALNELLLRTVQPGQTSKQLFQLHSNALALIENNLPEGRELTLFNLYFVKLLVWLGLFPQWKNCKTCKTSLAVLPKNKEIIGIPKEIAWMTGECFQLSKKQNGHATAFLPQTLIDSYISIGKPIRQALQESLASEKEHKRLFQYLISVACYHIPGFDEKPLKSLQFLDSESISRHPKVNSLQNQPLLD